MQAERGRSHPGFESLPSVASSLPQQQPSIPTLPSQIQEAQTQQHTQHQIPLTAPQQQTIQQGPQQQPPVAATQQIQIPQSYRPQLPRFTTPPGFMPWPRMPAPFNPWAARAALPQFQPRPPQQIPAQIHSAVQADQGPQQPPQAELQPPIQNPGRMGWGRRRPDWLRSRSSTAACIHTARPVHSWARPAQPL
jgi:hypothetical protein